MAKRKVSVLVSHEPIIILGVPVLYKPIEAVGSTDTPRHGCAAAQYWKSVSALPLLSSSLQT